jgi:hypothetical protein
VQAVGVVQPVAPAHVAWHLLEYVLPFELHVTGA